MNWKVLLHLPRAADATAYDYADTFGVQSSSIDGAKDAAKAWLTDHGFVVRSVSFSATKKDELIAYATKKEPR